MRTPVRALALLLAAALAGAACSDDTGGTVGAGGDPNAPVTGGDDPMPVDPGIGGPRPVAPTPGLDNPTTAAIESVLLVDERTLEVRFYTGVDACYGLDHVTVTETVDAVTVEVVTGARPEARGMACIDIAELVATLVTLDAPLGARPVVDASSGAQVTAGS